MLISGAFEVVRRRYERFRQLVEIVSRALLLDRRARRIALGHVGSADLGAMLDKERAERDGAGDKEGCGMSQAMSVSVITAVLLDPSLGRKESWTYT